MDKYNIEVTNEEFFQLLNKSLKEGDKLSLGLLLKTVRNNPSLVEAILEVSIPASSQSASSTYFDDMLRSNRFEWLETLLSHETASSYIEKALKKGLNKLATVNSNIKFFSQIEYAMKTHSIINTEKDIESSNFPINMSNTFKYFSDNLFKIAQSNSMLIKSFLNSTVERLPKDKSNNLIKKPAFFDYLMLFENNTEKLKQLDVIDWQIQDYLGQNILFHVLDYPPQLIDFIVSKMKNSDWDCKNIKEKTPGRRLSEVDFTKYHNVKRLNYMINNNYIPFENNDFRILVKRTIKSYKLKANSEDLNHEIQQTFSLLISHPLIKSVEGKNALEILEVCEDSKITDLKMTILNNKLQSNIENKPQKNKIKI